MAADVAQPGGADQCIGHRVQQHVGIRMAEQAGVMFDRDAADDERAARHQRMAIVALADSEPRMPRHLLPSKNSSASATSCGSVTLKLRGLPVTSFGCRPSASTAPASSVTSGACSSAWHSSP